MAGRGAGRQAKVERLHLVDETEADRQTIEIYELITRKVRVGRVPLLFKALAGEKALAACWQALRPAIRLRAFEEAADDIRATAARAAIDFGCPLIETQLEWAGYDVDEIDEIRGMIDILHYQAPKTFLAASVLLEALRGGTGGARETPRAMQRVPRGVPQEMDHIELVGEEQTGSLARSFKTVRDQFGLGLVPDEFRALGRWPKYLELALKSVQERCGANAGPVLDRLRSMADHAGTQLPVRVEVAEAALAQAGADPARVRAMLERFVKAMPEMVLDFAMMKVQLDGGEGALDSPFPIRWKYLSADDYMTPDVDEPMRLRAGDPTGLEELDDGADSRS